MVAQASLRRLLVASISLAAMAPACAVAQSAATQGVAPQPAAQAAVAPSATSAAAARDAAASTSDATSDATADSGASTVNELVVTARHESEKAIDVPIALTALPKESLQQNQA
jgi:hypothetical protein